MTQTVQRIVPARPRGGHLKHAKRLASWKALCGFGPSSPMAFKVYRMPRWDVWSQEDADETTVTCRKCLKKLKQIRQEAADRLIDNASV